MTKLIAALSLATALALASAMVPAVAQSTDQKPVAAKTHVKHRVSVTDRSSRHIACTFLGCQPVPANCFPVTQYNSDGMPTGFDAIACR